MCNQDELKNIYIIQKGGWIPRNKAIEISKAYFDVDGLTEEEIIYYPFPVPTNEFNTPVVTPKMKVDQLVYHCSFWGYLSSIEGLTIEEIKNLSSELRDEFEKKFFKNLKNIFKTQFNKKLDTKSITFLTCCEIKNQIALLRSKLN